MTLKERLAAALALHTPEDFTYSHEHGCDAYPHEHTKTICSHDRMAWPCPTYKALSA